MYLPPPLLDELLHSPQAPLLALLRNQLIGVCLIQDGLLAYASPRLAEMFGYAPEQLCDRFGLQDLSAAWDRVRVEAEVAARIERDASAGRFCFTGLASDGREVEIEAFGSRMLYRQRPAMFGILHDIGARRSAERQMREQLHFTAQLLDTIPNPVFYKDAHGRYLGGNAAFERYIGIARAQLLGKSVFDIAPPELAARYHAADQALFDQPGTQSYETSVATADKGRRDVMFYKATFNNTDGTLGGLVGVMLDITERKQAEAQAWQHANFDTLTGLPNRRLLHDRLQQELAHAQRDGSTLALLFIDLDRFREVNDSLGHANGDALLQQAAQRIQQCVRNSDTVARQGGDEFIVVLPQLPRAAAAASVAQALLTTLAEPFRLGDESVHLAASIGVALYPDDATALQALLNSADQAMYDAKMLGGNRCSYFSRQMQQATLQRLQLGRELRQALAAQQLQLYYQPVVELTSGRICKAEALLRWQHPQRGLILPAEFIPIAEDLGLIHAIGDWVLHQAAAMALRWQQASRAAPVQIAINMSPRQIAGGSAPQYWPQHLATLGLPGHCIGIEITESSLLDARPEVAQRLALLRGAGMQIALDDFGTGYSAMAYLKKFAIDYLKIDRSFIRDMSDDNGDRAIVEAIVAMAHKLGLQVVAEGVETAQQQALLQQCGCDFGQGFHFAAPLSGAEFARLLQL